MQLVILEGFLNIAEYDILPQFLFGGGLRSPECSCITLLELPVIRTIWLSLRPCSARKKYAVALS